METAEPSGVWEDAEWAAALTALLTTRIGGVHLRAPPGPVREYWLTRLQILSGQSRLRKIPANVPESRLLGGIDLAATLAQGKPIAERGLLTECDDHIVIAAMAERMPRNTIHHLCSALDEGLIKMARDGIEAASAARLTLIAADEGTEEETLHPALTDRLGISLDLERCSIHDVGDEQFSPQHINSAAQALKRVHLNSAQRETLVGVSLSLGIPSPRPTLAALEVARGCAALSGRESVAEEDLARAVRLSLLPLAQRLPEAVASQPEPPAEPESDSNSPDEQTPPKERDAPDQEHLLNAAFAQLPDGLLQQLQARASRNRQRSIGKSGAQQKHLLRGRPTGVFKGDYRRGGRINILATLRAAAPWQPLRRRERPDSQRALDIRRDDIHLTRFQQRRDTLTLFVVDASGSAALQRLAEAKGAVELLLADCYVRRDQVALIAFREDRAELLLPPTRSLVRAKKALAALPGGGATPMAAALDLTREIAQRVDKGGTTVHYVLLTDGAANIARDGSRGREFGTNDALAAAKVLAASGVAGLVIDTALRPQPRARDLADALKCPYIALPKADAQALNQTIRAASA